MTCAWKELLAVLPVWMRKDVDMQAENLRELRLRINAPPELIVSKKRQWLDGRISQDDLQYTVNVASKYSPWRATTAAQGYITAAGGHRIGLCGEAVIRNGDIVGMDRIRSLCIRVARDFPGIALGLEQIHGSLLILGAPGWGKSTLLRDLVRQISQKEQVCVVDEREELFPPQIDAGKGADVLSGCVKRIGIPMLLRTMAPDCIAVDEITEPDDVQALIQAANCGVRLLATAHATSLADFSSRCVYRPLIEHHVFHTLVILNRNNTYTMERMSKWNSDGLVQL